MILLPILLALASLAVFTVGLKQYLRESEAPKKYPPLRIVRRP